MSRLGDGAITGSILRSSSAAGQNRALSGLEPKPSQWEWQVDKETEAQLAHFWHAAFLRGCGKDDPGNSANEIEVARSEMTE